MSETFVDLCLAGRARPEDVDDFVDRWHEGSDPRPLAEFLGLTEAEYARWVADASSLPGILRARPYPMAQPSAAADEAREDEEPYGPR